MALAEDIKGGIDLLKTLQEKAKGNKEELEKAAKHLESLADAIKSLANGDASKIEITRTQWSNVNRLLAAKASAEQELTKGASPDWEAIGDTVAGVARIIVKVGLAVGGI